MSPTTGDRNQHARSRHDFVRTSSSSILVALLTTTTTQAGAATAAVVPPPQRDVGDGLDLLQPAQLKASDVIYPISMEGIWNCQRVVKSVAGDEFAAETMWRALGGGGGGGGSNDDGTKTSWTTLSEQYMTRFIPESTSTSSSTSSPSSSSLYTVMDREYEMKSRTGSDQVVWDRPNQLTYCNMKKNTNNKIQLSVLRRTVEIPNDDGFGYQEFVSVQDGILFQRAALIKRRYRRAFDEVTGKRIVQGLELVQTFRVLDGVAGTEFPTSTTKSLLTLTRP